MQSCSKYFKYNWKSKSINQSQALNMKTPEKVEKISENPLEGLNFLKFDDCPKTSLENCCHCYKYLLIQN